MAEERGRQNDTGNRVHPSVLPQCCVTAISCATASGAYLVAYRLTLAVGHRTVVNNNNSQRGKNLKVKRSFGDTSQHSPPHTRTHTLASCSYCPLETMTFPPEDHFVKRWMWLVCTLCSVWTVLVLGVFSKFTWVEAWSDQMKRRGFVKAAIFSPNEGSKSVQKACQAGSSRYLAPFRRLKKKILRLISFVSLHLMTENLSNLVLLESCPDSWVGVPNSTRRSLFRFAGRIYWSSE